MYRNVTELSGVSGGTCSNLIRLGEAIILNSLINGN